MKTPPELPYPLRPQPGLLAAASSLRHFVILTYALPPERLAPHLPEVLPAGFELETIVLQGERKALLSVVPFLNTHFRSARFPGPHFTMGQTNYRVYLYHPQSQARAVWFLGTVLDSWSLFVPRHYWQLPWHRGHMDFDCHYSGKQLTYRLNTRSDWGPMQLTLKESAAAITFPGFNTPEQGWLCITHPLTGYYRRRDGQLGTYRIWHGPLQLQSAQLETVQIGLLERLGLISLAEQQQPYQLLLEAANEFTIYLPPQRLPAAGPAN